MNDSREGWVYDERVRQLRPLAFGVVLALIAVVSLAAVSGIAAADAPSCVGTGDDFAGGDGSEGNEYQIANVEQFQCLNHTAHLDAYAVLTSDIDASETGSWNGGDGFAPIGEDGDGFTGSFDGKGHTISDLTINRSGENRVGLFGYVGPNGSVSNATVDGTVTGDTHVGGLVGWNEGDVTATTATVAVSGNGRIGGLVGNNIGTVSAANATGSVDGSGDGVGGLVGLNNGVVTNSSATGDVTGDSGDVGGLVGDGNAGSSIDRSYATGNVDGYDFVGGLVGTNSGTIDRSYATSNVESDFEAGGLVGQGLGDISRSYATGSVTGSGARVGGLVGIISDGTLENSYWDEGTTSQSDAIGTVGTGGSVSNVVGFDSGDGSPAPEMTGADATENMDALAFPDTWLVTGSYPALAWSVTGPSYGVTVEEKTSPDAPRDSFEVTVNVTNFGTAGGSQTITLTDTNFTDTVQDSAAVSDLDNGESTELTLTWADSVDDDGDGVVTVASENDTAALTVWPYAGGDGSAANPYEIETWYHLDNVRKNPDANYTLGADLDSTTAGYDLVASESANGDAGFDPIGDDSTQFTGSLDGQSHTISNLTIDRSYESYVGLVGYVGADGSLSNVSIQAGSVNGSTYVGGLVGWNDGTVTASSTTGNVGGDTRVGGVVGFNDGIVARSTASGPVDAFDGDVDLALGDAAGGLVGYNRDGSVTNSSAIGNVTGVEERVGGLVGVNRGTVTTSYAAGVVAGASDVGGLIGNNDGGTVEDAYWDAGTTGQSDAIGAGDTGTNLIGFDAGDGSPSPKMQGEAAVSNMTALDFTTTWETVDSSDGDATANGYPILQTIDRQVQLRSRGLNSFAGGDGSADQPYEIVNWNHLHNIRDALDANFALIADLDDDTAGYDDVANETANGNAGFTPIGNDSTRFNGTIDGQGHTISDLTVNRSDEDHVGLVGSVGVDGSVVGVSLVDASVTGGNAVGTIVGLNNGTVADASATGNVTGGRFNVGGLVGLNDGGTVIETSASVAVDGSDARVGGLVGLMIGGSVANSSSSGPVDGGTHIGGLVGWNTGGSITDARATGTVTGDRHNIAGLVGWNQGTVDRSHTTGNVSGNLYVGGLVGSNDGGAVMKSSADTTVRGDDYIGGLVGWNGGTVSDSNATGTVGGDRRVAGLVGNNLGTVSTSYATGNVDAAGDGVGGLVGLNNADVADSYATGNVSTGGDNVGSLVGRNNPGSSIIRSYAVGTVDGDSGVGGLVGFNDGVSVTNAYWDLHTTNQSTSDGGTDLTTGEMQRFAPATTMPGFDFTATWNLTNGYPRLQWEGVAAITVDSLDAADITITEDVTGTVTVTANEGGGHAGQGVTVEVTDADGLDGISNSDTAVTDASGEATFDVTEPTPGDYLPAFAWQDDAVTDSATVIVEDATAPTADAGTDKVVDEDTPVGFDGSASTDNVGITGYEWDWTSDGTYEATGANPSHTYADPGTYTVTLRVTDAAGNINTDTQSVTVYAVALPTGEPGPDTTAPTAVAGPDLTVAANDTVSFDGSNSSDDVDVVAYEWELGDGTTATSQTPTHAYAQPGSYTVKLTVSDAAGNEGTDSLEVTVADTTSPVADAGPNQTVDEGVPVNLDASATTDNVGVDTYEWTFGDGTTGTGTTPRHTYTQPGTYTVGLTVTDAAGNVATDALTVTVYGDSSGGLENGEGSYDLDGNITRLVIGFADADASGIVTVESSDTLPDDAPAIQDASGLGFVDLTVPSPLTDSEATMRFTLDAVTLGDREPDDLVVTQFDDGEWSALETAVVSTDGGEVVLEATISGISLVAVSHATQRTTPEETPEAAQDDQPPAPGDEEESTGIGNLSLVTVLGIVVSVVSLGLFLWTRRRS